MSTTPGGTPIAPKGAAGASSSGQQTGSAQQAAGRHQMTGLTLSEVKAAATNLVLETQSEAFFTDRQKREVLECFSLNCGNALDQEETQIQAFSNFLSFIADNGGSQSASSDALMEVKTRNITDGTITTTIGETFNTILEELGKLGPWYTNRRLLNTFCNEVSLLLNARPGMTVWGIKNYMPLEFKKFAFPGGEHCRDVTDGARKALLAAKNFALLRASEQESTLAGDFVQKVSPSLHMGEIF